MDKKKVSWSRIMDRFTQFEEKFNNDPNDPVLNNFFEHLADEVLEAGFSRDQLSEIVDKMNNLRNIFASRKLKLESMSRDVQERKKQLHRYIKNANYKNNVN